MKNLHNVIQSILFTLLFTFCSVIPSSLIAQISSDKPGGNQLSTTASSIGNPIVTFKIDRASAFSLDSLLIIDLPAGASLQHNGDGVFQINNMPEIYGHYNIKLRTGGNILNGVTTADISFIQRHILGNGTLENEFKLIAADVNCDGRISAKDMVDIRRAILGNISKFECDTNFTFSPNSLNFEWTGSTIDLGVFHPIKLGDVNGSATFNSEN